MSQRRDLSYTSLDEVMPDVDQLLQGYHKVGNWSLGQICYHLSRSLQRTVEGPPVKAPWLMRVFLGKLAKRYVMSSGRMPAGVKIPVVGLEPPSNLDDRAEAEALRASIRLFLASNGPFGKHPMFGTLTPEEWKRFHCIHCAHHLSFVLPKSATT